MNKEPLTLDELKEYFRLCEQVKGSIPFLMWCFTPDEVFEIMQWKYRDPFLEIVRLRRTDPTQLRKFISEHSETLRYFIEKWSKRIQQSPELSYREKEDFFGKYGIEDHYLNFKSIDKWHSSDEETFIALLFTHGKAEEVYAVFLLDPDNTAFHAVSTQDTFFFDTTEEAEEEVQKLTEERGYSPGMLRIQSLFKIN